MEKVHLFSGSWISLRLILDKSTSSTRKYLRVRAAGEQAKHFLGS